MGRVIISASTGSAASTKSAALEESAALVKGGVLPGITRTILPTQTPVFSSYVVVFSSDDYPDVELDNTQTQGIDGTGAVWELPAGDWTAKVYAYRALTTGGTEYPAAQGYSAEFTVREGRTTPGIVVPIAPVSVAEQEADPGESLGLFTYTVTFPQDAEGWLTFGGEDPVSLTSGVEGFVEIPPGVYDLSVTLHKEDGSSAGLMEKVHIYAGLESNAVFTFTNEKDFASKVYLKGTVILSDEATIASGTIGVYSYADYTDLIGTASVSVSVSSSSWIVGVPVSYAGAPLFSLAITSGTDGKPYVGTWASGGPVGEAGTQGIEITAYDRITSLDVVRAYLKAVSGGATVNDPPVPLPVTLNLPSDWAGLLGAIAVAGKYVALDLSACNMTNTEFDPVYPIITGKAYITDLVLPDAATSIKAGSEGSPTFRYFSALKSVSGSGIITVGDYAFYNCPKLTTVNLTTGNPLVAMSIGHSAFAMCKYLTTVNLEAATDIGAYAFSNCTSLEEVNLPSATSIGDNAFEFCSALETVTLSSATAIGKEAFAVCSALPMVDLPEVKTIGTDAFYGCVELTTVNLLAATDIGTGAFSYCVKLTTVSLGINAPKLGVDMFYGIDDDKTVVVKVPSGAEDGVYGTISHTYSGNDDEEEWGNGFRGGGWTGLIFMNSGYINPNIWLRIEYQ
jgi:hypothetical protein